MPFTVYVYTQHQDSTLYSDSMLCEIGPIFDRECLIIHIIIYIFCKKLNSTRKDSYVLFYFVITSKTGKVKFIQSQLKGNNFCWHFDRNVFRVKVKMTRASGQRFSELFPLSWSTENPLHCSSIILEPVFIHSKLFETIVSYMYMVCAVWLIIQWGRNSYLQYEHSCQFRST